MPQGRPLPAFSAHLNRTPLTLYFDTDTHPTQPTHRRRSSIFESILHHHQRNGKKEKLNSVREGDDEGEGGIRSKLERDTEGMEKYGESDEEKEEKGEGGSYGRLM
ncbi:hypothetical protein BDV19DRAFT_386305 [Aspergillus venezuelensis]